MADVSEKNKGDHYLKKRVHAFRAAFQGVRFGWKEGAHFQLYIPATVLVIIAGFWLKVNALEWCILVGCCGLVILTELINTAIEKLADRVTMEFDPLIGKVKDLAAAAVVISALTALIIGGIIFLPKILNKV